MKTKLVTTLVAACAAAFCAGAQADQSGRSGGPCVYKGADMKSSHANLDVKKSDFHALVEVLRASMDAKGIAPRQRNEMLALLAPMHRDIITPK